MRLIRGERIKNYEFQNHYEKSVAHLLPICCPKEVHFGVFSCLCVRSGEQTKKERSHYWERSIPYGVRKNMAEGEGFEPSVTFATSVFKTGALNQTLPPLRVGETLDKGVEFGK